DQRHLEIDHRESGEHAGAEHRLQALLDTRDELLRHRAADDLVLELETLAGLERRGDDLDAGELARAAGLLLVRIIDRDLTRDLLAVGHLRRANIGLDLVGALEDVDLDVEVEFAHALEDSLARLLIGGDAEGRVLGRELGESDAELLLVGLRLRLDRDLDDRVGELHLLEDHRVLRIAQRVAGARFLEAGERDDVARIGLIAVIEIVGVHQQHAADALLAVTPPLAYPAAPL